MRPIVKFKALLLAVVISLPMIVSAQVKDTLSTSAKIDSIYSLEKKIYREVKNEPLAHKKFGIEVNVLRLLLLDKAFTFSGSFSLFNVDRHAEIAFPVYYQNPKNSADLTEFTLDCHYRYFLGRYQNGFYLSAFTRYAYLKGTLGDNDLFNSPLPGAPKDTEHKLGIGIGLGYRIFSYRGLYWGTSLSFGRYFIGKNSRFAGDFLALDDDEEFILDVELLKFGFAF